VFYLRTLYPVINPWVELLFFALFVGLGACGMYSFFGELSDRIGGRNDQET
jgi:hypothetical protein